MYQITRKNRIREELQLCHEDGTVALTATVDINVDRMASTINHAISAVQMAKAEVKKQPNSEAAVNAVGTAILELFNAIFGEENAAKIVEFYEGCYTEMLLDVFPFIADEIIPKVRAASADRKAQLLAAAKRTGR